MSAFLAVNYGDRIELLTDGAIYTEDGTLVATREKVVRIASVPAAITSRGAMGALNAVGLYLEMVGLVTGSFDKTMVQLDGFVAKMKDKPPAAFEMVICGISESEGPLMAYFCSAKVYPHFEPFTLYRIYDGDFCGGAGLDIFQAMESEGIKAEDFREGLAAKGADLMELMRREPGPNPIRPDLPDQFGIGGHVDHTVIRADGVTTTRLRTWPDTIGEKIDPFAEDAPVTISRQQRRAMQRKQQKLEAA